MRNKNENTPERIKAVRNMVINWAEAMNVESKGEEGDNDEWERALCREQADLNMDLEVPETNGGTDKGNDSDDKVEEVNTQGGQ